ncbi:MAG TPA: hypothetical protein P5287_07475 [bacterium]|nr:hypothetical protein [bacterium]
MSKHADQGHGCSHKDHEENHICRIIIRKDLDRVRKLVANAQFYCKNCGRAAASGENLCNPSKI